MSTVSSVTTVTAMVRTAVAVVTNETTVMIIIVKTDNFTCETILKDKTVVTDETVVTDP